MIRRGFEPLIEAGLVTVTTLARATPAKLHGYLSNGEFDVVHFIGHGIYDEERGEGRLVFVNEQGQEYSLGERSVREIFCRRNLSLVFLNACESGAAGRADFNKGVAQSLVAHGLPAVVANQYSVLDSSATSFAQHFYWSLAQGNSLGQSAREARIAVNYSLHGEPIDWAVPVLYARDFKPGAVQAACKAQLRSRNPRAPRLTACDCCTQRPRRRLGHGQCLSGIGSHARADECRPEGIWLRARPAVGSTRCLGPAGRQNDVSTGRNALQIDCAGCRSSWKSTSWPVSRVIGCGMMSGMNIYGWWPNNREPPILIQSVAGFDQLAPEGPETDRVIANEMVSSLAGFYGNLDGHAKGSKKCPLFFNGSATSNISPPGSSSTRIAGKS